MADFPAAFLRAVSLSGLTQRTFAKLAGITQGHVSNVITGKRLPPLDRMQEWADLLGIYGEDRAEFVRLAEIAHTPPGIRAEYLRLREGAADVERARRRMRSAAARRVRP